MISGRRDEGVLAARNGSIVMKITTSRYGYEYRTPFTQLRLQRIEEIEIQAREADGGGWYELDLDPVLGWLN